MQNKQTKPSFRSGRENEYNAAYYQKRQFYIDAITLAEPNPGELALYLNRYLKENKDEHYERIKRIAQVNFVDLIIDLYCSLLFSANVQIKAQNHQAEVDAFVNRCNAQGDPLLDYMREMIGPLSLLYGIVDVFVDKPNVAGDILTKAQEMERGLDAPYIYLVTPLNRVGWSLDDSREYTFYQSQDILNQQVQGGYGISDSQQNTVWTKETVEFLDQDGKPTEASRPNPYGFIPCVSVIPTPSKRFHADRMGDSLITDILDQQKLVLNLYSLILDYHEQVNYGFRVYKHDQTAGDEPPTENDMIEAGNRRGLIIKGPGSDFKVITPDPAGVDAMRVFLGDVIDNIYRSAFLPSDSNYNKTHQSSGGIRANHAQLYNRLTRIAKYFERATKQIIEMALKVQGIDPTEAGVTVQWSTNFSFEALINAIEEWTQLRAVAQDISPTLVTEYGKKVINPHLYNSPKIDQIEAELDAWKGPPAPSPANPDDPNNPAQEPRLQQENVAISAAEKISDAPDEGT